jgi:hypothetical protein
MVVPLTGNNYSPAAAASLKPAPRGSGIVLILGAPRSGTSWLGKIFDSHPGVIYRHEPDDVIRQQEFPGICQVDEIPRYQAAARRYIAQLTTVRQIKASGTWPIFAKPFQPFPAPIIRRALVIGVRAGEAIAPDAGWLKRIPIPDFIRGEAAADSAAAIVYVIKSVSLLGATALLANALPESPIIAIFRHPCGQIASIKRGLSVRSARGDMFGAGVLATTRARELGFTTEDYEKLPLLERWVCGWAFTHAKLLEDIRGLANVRLLRYEDLCQNPMQQARELAAFAGLSWSEEVARFIRRSTGRGDSRRYHSLFRDPIVAATKWKRELAPAEIERYMSIVNRVLPGLFAD